MIVIENVSDKQVCINCTSLKKRGGDVIYTAEVRELLSPVFQSLALAGSV